jgi:hypothetical protein
MPRPAESDECLAELTPRDCEGQFKLFLKVNAAAIAVDHCGQRLTKDGRQKKNPASRRDFP